MANSLKIVTYNIRCVYEGDGINAFMHRAGLLWDTIQKEQPDVIGFQEVTGSILKLLKVILNDYEIVGHGRDPEYDGEGLYVAVKKSTCSILSANTYWLGDDPYNFSQIEGQCCPRIFNSVLIKLKNCDTKFRVYNTHLDCNEIAAVRLHEINNLLAKATEEYKQSPAEFVIMGDFNTTPNETPVLACLDYTTAKLTDLTCDIKHTFHDYKANAPECKIDYIFATNELTSAVKSINVWDRCSSGVYLSDHYPICAEFEV